MFTNAYNVLRKSFRVLCFCSLSAAFFLCGITVFAQTARFEALVAVPLGIGSPTQAGHWYQRRQQRDFRGAIVSGKRRRK
jgi:hypothetical protein